MSDLYPHGQCPACGWGLTPEDGSCPNDTCLNFYITAKPEAKVEALDEVASFLRKRLRYEDVNEYEVKPDPDDEKMIEGSGADHASVLYELIAWLEKSGLVPVTPSPLWIDTCANCGERIREDDNEAGGTVWCHEFGSTVCGDDPPGSVEGVDLDTATP